ncbi:MAG: HD domain-containing protein [Candidatus Altiarchaeota archaeon]
MKPVKYVRDPIHGNIRLDALEKELLDTPHMQRLRNVKQNGFCYLVYPAMNSTRFEHSIGVMHLAGLVSEYLSLDEADTQSLKAACLLHDVGHGPFSHTSDNVLTRRGIPHEARSCEIIAKTEVADVLDRHGIEPTHVAGLVMGVGSIGKLVSSEIDLDKMDYLIRDSYYAGVAYGVIDVERVLYNLTLEDDDLYVNNRGLEAVELLLVSRNLMYQTVYRHHTKRIAESMFAHALENMLEEGMSPDELSSMDDISLISHMRRQEGYVKDITSRIDERRLFKKIFHERINMMTETFRKELEENIRAIESKIASDYSVEDGYALLDFPEIRLNEFKVKIEVDGEYKRIDEVSTLARDLEKSEKEKLLFNIYAAPEQLGKLSGFKPEDYIEYAQTRLGKFT